MRRLDQRFKTRSSSGRLDTDLKLSELDQQFLHDLVVAFSVSPPYSSSYSKFLFLLSNLYHFAPSNPKFLPHPHSTNPKLLHIRNGFMAWRLEFGFW